jgi:thiamine-monophosphate kinase
MRELEVIDRFRKAFPEWGIGDDAAVLPPSEGEILFAADAAVEGVHFDRRFCTLSQAVQKLVTSNVSDVFAMGGTPGSIVITAGLPRGCTRGQVDGVIDGLRRSCAQYGVKLVGGDTVLCPEAFVFTIAILGEAKRGRAVRRAGAHVGDDLVLFGELGRSLAGLRLLSALHGEKNETLVPARMAAALRSSARRIERELPCLTLSTSGGELDRVARALGPIDHAGEMAGWIRHHLTPLAVPLDAALLDREPPALTAMIDVSDGLAKDLHTLCAESGVGAVVHEDAIPVPSAIKEAFELDERSLVELALSSGEEYVLLASVAAGAIGGSRAAKSNGAMEGSGVATSNAAAVVIGSIVPAQDGIMLAGPAGRRRELPPLGYEHAF